MRNTFTIYSPRTDLRGKKVLLRNDSTALIPKDAERYAGDVKTHITYRWPCEAVFQNCQREDAGKHQYDIMKVIK